MYFLFEYSWLLLVHFKEVSQISAGQIPGRMNHFLTDTENRSLTDPAVEGSVHNICLEFKQ